MSFQEILNIFESFTVILASSVAIWGVINWRNKALSQKKLDFGLYVLEQFYLMKLYAERIKNPFSFSDEIEKANISKETPNYQKIQRYTIIHNRSADVLQSVLSLSVKSGLFKYYFSGSRKLDEVVEVLRGIYFSSKLLIEYYGSPATLKVNAAKISELEKKLEYDESDRNSDKIKEAIEFLEKKLNKG